jgi:glycosyltransferase involved in cell wall biosynthesis
VIVGREPDNGILRRAVEETGLGNRVVFTGYLSEPEVMTVLKHSVALAFPSFYEGFGLPVLEAMAAEVPVACSNVAALPEVAGEAAIFFDPESVDDIARAVSRLWHDGKLRMRLVALGRERIKQFTCERIANETAAVYERIARHRTQ